MSQIYDENWHKFSSLKWHVTDALFCYVSKNNITTELTSDEKINIINTNLQIGHTYNSRRLNTGQNEIIHISSPRKKSIAPNLHRYKISQAMPHQQNS